VLESSPKSGSGTGGTEVPHPIKKQAMPARTNLVLNIYVQNLTATETSQTITHE
jgi:hypothetical protein